jgi:hypothetical protein
MLVESKSSNRNSSASPRNGAVLIAVVVVFTISLTLFGVWARAAVKQHQSMRNEQLRLQAVRLAEAGVRRALARRAADAQYMQETWQVSATELNASQSGEVRIRVVPHDDAPAVRFEAIAEFPAGSVRRARITKQIEIANQAQGE